jgi:hypothetical protein
MRTIAGAFRTTPVAALEAELGIPPADIRLEYKQQSYAAKLRVRYNHSERKNHTKFFAKTLSHWPKPLFFSFTPSF